MAVSKAQQKAVAKYIRNNYDEIKVRLPKGDKERIQAAAAAQGASMNRYIQDAIWDRMEREDAERSQLPSRIGADLQQRAE